jgi:hypothetical protein
LRRSGWQPVVTEFTDEMREFKNTYWGRQIETLAHELSVLSIACDIELGKPGRAERVVKNDKTVCGQQNPEAFRMLRQHLMALFIVEDRALDESDADHQLEILDHVRTAINHIQRAGNAGESRSDEDA